MTLHRELQNPPDPPPPVDRWKVEIQGFGTITVDAASNLTITDLDGKEIYYVLSYEEADELETALREAREQRERQQHG
jgi:hypothetical protein